MERIEHVEVVVSIEEIKKLLGLPTASTVVALAPPDVGAYQGIQQQMAGSLGQPQFQERTQGGTSKLRFRFTRDQEATKVG